MEQSSFQFLVAASEADLRGRLSAWLREAGQAVTEANDTEAAWGIIARGAPQVILMEWLSGSSTALDLCRRVRAQATLRHRHIILLREGDFESSGSQAWESGADDCWPASISRSELLARLPAVFRVIQLERDWARLANRDSLTRIPNRHGFEEILHRELHRANRYRHPISCVVVDVDHFKWLNDREGHAVGDMALTTTADVLLDATRGTDFVGRLGGDEFVILLPETRLKDAIGLAERARQSLEESLVRVFDKEQRVSASFGVAEFVPGDGGDGDDLLRRADLALMTAKRQGRNRVHPPLDTGSELLHAEATLGVRLFGDRPVSEIMTTPILVLSEETPIREAAELQLKMRIHSLPVVDSEGLLVGMVEDAALLALDSSSHIWNASARDFMTRGVVHYDQSVLARTVYDFLCRLTVRRVVIVDGGKPVGIVSRGNILRWLGNWGELRKSLTLSELDQIRAGNMGGARSAALSTAAGMAKQAWSLYESLRKPDADFVPCVVDNASRIQALVTDLLAGTQMHYSFAPLDSNLFEASG